MTESNSGKPVTIGKPTDSPLSFEQLRSSGIRMLQELSWEGWSDFNLHDPGVTILEQLCFAITDLAYRGDFSIEELLTDKDGHISYNDNAYLHRACILSSNPVTINDLRKVIYDEFREVRNVWIETVKCPFTNGHVNGFYIISVQLKDESESEENGHAVRAAILLRMSAIRNIGEQFYDVKILKPQKVQVHAEIVIKERNVPEDVMADIYLKIDAILNPAVIYYSEEELIKRGYDTNDIYTGPLLSNGIIPEDELKPVKKRLDAAELMEAISHIDNVLYVNLLKISDGKNERLLDSCLRKKGYYLCLDKEQSYRTTILRNDKYKHSIDGEQLASSLRTKRYIAQLLQKNNVKHTSHEQKKRPDKHITEYHSLQRTFPAIYGIGPDGLRPGVTTQRKAEAKQLKAFLMIFEQVLAGHLAQLGHIKHIFSMQLPEGDRTYATQPLYDVPGAAEMINAFTSKVSDKGAQGWSAFMADALNEHLVSLQQKAESAHTYFKRKMVLGDHVLARYNEQLSLYPVTSFNKTYRVNPLADQDKDILEYRSVYYNNLVNMGQRRTTMNADDGNDTIGWLQWKIMFLLNIKRYDPVTGASWHLSQGSECDLSIATEHVNIVHSDMGSPNSSSDTSETANEYIFRKEPVSFFKNAIRSNRYAIRPTASGLRYLTWYRDNGDKEYVINSHPNLSVANADLKKLTARIKALSINSEGFHIVEHFLLAPPLEHKAFAVKYARMNGQVLLQHTHTGRPSTRSHGIRQFMTFDERNKLISTIVSATQKEGPYADEDKFSFLQVLADNHMETAFSLPFFRSEKEYMKHVEEIMWSIRALPDMGRVNTQFALYVKLDDDTVVSEDVFNMQITVALPSWPARFQYSDFREYIRQTFRSNIPAHIRINYKWMGIPEMKRFEAARKVLKHSWGTDGSNAARRDMLMLLAKEYVINEVI